MAPSIRLARDIPGATTMDGAIDTPGGLPREAAPGGCPGRLPREAAPGGCPRDRLASEVRDGGWTGSQATWREREGGGMGRPVPAVFE